MEINELLSVVIPVYNVGKYLRKCLESVINQTYRRMEILLVDDGSTDESGEICKEYAGRDHRVHYYHQTNKGSGEARNLGISKAVGAFITFLDSDDWWAPNYAEKMLAGFEDDVDITICDLVYVYSDRQETSTIRLPKCKAVRVEDDPDVINKARTFLWGKVFRKSLLDENNIKQPTMAINDIPIVTLMSAKARKVKRIPYPLYYYLREREGSYVNSMISLTSFADAIDEMYRNFDTAGLTFRFDKPLKKMLYSQVRFALRKGLEAVKSGAGADEYRKLFSAMEACMNRHWPDHPHVYDMTFSSNDRDIQYGIRNLVIRDDGFVPEGTADFVVAYEDDPNTIANIRIKRSKELKESDLYWDVADQILFILPAGGQ